MSQCFLPLSSIIPSFPPLCFIYVAAIHCLPSFVVPSFFPTKSGCVQLIFFGPFHVSFLSRFVLLTTTHPVSQPVSQPVVQLLGRSLSKPVIHSVIHSLSLPVIQYVSQSATLSFIQSVNPPVSHNTAWGIAFHKFNCIHNLHLELEGILPDVYLQRRVQEAFGDLFGRSCLSDAVINLGCSRPSRAGPVCAAPAKFVEDSIKILGSAAGARRRGSFSLVVSVDPASLSAARDKTLLPRLSH